MRTCDLFCRVIDNFGDAGIAWRLGLSLTRECGWNVRLIIDDVATLAAFVPQVDTRLDAQTVDSIGIVRWNDAFERTIDTAADIVIEAFSCYLPEAYEQAVAQAIPTRDVRVFALDYLTAERYAEDSHGLLSPHPRFGYPKTFVFPGFTPKTGGIIYEADLAERIESNRKRRSDILTAIGADPAHPFTLFFFTYPTVPVEAFVRSLAADPRPVQVVLAPGEASEMFEQTYRAIDSPAHVRVVRAPMVPQSAFDGVLQSVDCALVRGEDSVMRAQLVGTPLIWTLYPQTEETHVVKLQAFARLYREHLPEAARDAWMQIELGLNRGDLNASAWAQWRDRYDDMRAAATSWRAYLFSQPSLTQRLRSMVSVRR